MSTLSPECLERLMRLSHLTEDPTEPLTEDLPELYQYAVETIAQPNYTLISPCATMHKTFRVEEPTIQFRARPAYRLKSEGMEGRHFRAVRVMEGDIGREGLRRLRATKINRLLSVTDARREFGALAAEGWVRIVRNPTL